MKLLILLVFLIPSAFAWRGGGKDGGNGGIVIVCRDRVTGTITQAQLLDLYEGNLLFTRNYETSLDHQSLIDRALERLSRYPQLKKLLLNELALVTKDIVMIPKGNVLVLTEDAFPSVKPAECDFEQVAHYTSDGMLLISFEIFEKLNEVSRAALYLHEALYSLNRKMGETSSQRTRRVIAQLVADTVDFVVLDRYVEQVDFAFDGRFSGKYRGRPDCRAEIIKTPEALTSRLKGECIFGESSSDKYLKFSPADGESQIYVSQYVNTWPNRFDVYIYLVFQDEDVVLFATSLEDAKNGVGLILKRQN